MDVAQKKCFSCGKVVRLGKNLKDRVSKRKTNVIDQKNIINGRDIMELDIMKYYTTYTVGYYGILNTFDSRKLVFQINTQAKPNLKPFKLRFSSSNVQLLLF